MASFDSIFASAEVKKTQHPNTKIIWLHYTKLVDSEFQYCNEKDKQEIIDLAMTIKIAGRVLENLIVRKADADTYEILAGHKRRRAVRYLIEELHEDGFEFLPCICSTSSDVRSEIEVIVSNKHHPKTDAEKLHEIERMTYLLQNHPDEFPHLDSGRMVERLAKQLNMARTTAGEYLNISKNLGAKGREAFDKGEIKKSAAVELASLPVTEQEQLIESGVTAHKDIKAYKEKSKLVQTSMAEMNNKESMTIEDVLPGQYQVINTDMDIAGDEEVSAADDIKKAYDEVCEVLPKDELVRLNSTEIGTLDIPAPEERKTIKNKKLVEAYELMEKYRTWTLVEKCSLMNTNYYQTTLTNADKVIAEEIMVERKGRISFIVHFYLVTPNVRYNYDGFIQEKALAQAIANTL